MVQNTENTYLFSAYAKFSTVFTFKLASLKRSPSKPSKNEMRNDIKKKKRQNQAVVITQ